MPIQIPIAIAPLFLILGFPFPIVIERSEMDRILFFDLFGF